MSRELSVSDCAAGALEAVNAIDASVVLVLPPFASPDRPSLGLHILQQVAKSRDVEARVVYSNLAFARLIGPKLYRELCHTPTGELVGERLFRLARPSSARLGPGKVPDAWTQLRCNPPSFRRVQLLAARWASEMGRLLAELPAKIIGFSSSFEQTASSLALAAAVRRFDPNKVLLLGGANADGPMGEALADYAPEIDHVFQGEAEISFAKFLDAQIAGAVSPRISVGESNESLDAIPQPDYSDFFAQWQRLVDETSVLGGLPHSDLRLPYESSRGCWWGEKHHCTFCGLNANGMTHRVKSPEKVYLEISNLAKIHGVDRIMMTDNIMPHTYFSTLLPRLARAEQKFELFYEQKANLGRRRMALLRDAGVRYIQPGIESLSDGLLRRMNKGTSLRINLQCLRHARAAGISVAWNLLADFPGDQAGEYEDMMSILPTIHHLEPPSGLSGLSIDRFSPYFETPGKYGIEALDPLPAYSEAFPDNSDPQIAYHFRGRYSSALRTDTDLRNRLKGMVDLWRSNWETQHPIFHLFSLESGNALVVDTRRGEEEVRIADGSEANLLLNGTNQFSSKVKAALDRNELVEKDNSYISLASADLDSSFWDS